MAPTQSGIRRVHEGRVLAALREHGALSRADLSGMVGLSRTTLSEITADLLQRGAIVVTDTDAGTRVGSGRPAERLALDPGSGQYVGLDFQHRRVDAVVADAAHETLASGTEPYAEDTPWRDRIAAAFGLIDRLASDNDVHYGALKGVAIGIPGPYIPPTLRLTLPPSAEANRRFGDEVARAFTERYRVPVHFDNNTRLAALAEANAPGASADLLYLRLGDGLGGGLVVGGRLVLGRHALAGELGHVRVPGATAPCRCSKVGCLETIASATAILAECRRRGVAADGVHDLRESDPRVAAVAREAAEALAGVLKPVLLALDPGEVVMAGTVCRTLPSLVTIVADAVAAEGFAGLGQTQVRGSRITSFDGALGAVQALFATSPLLAGYAETVEGV